MPYRLKDNRSLWKGVVTGVLRVAKDSVLTDLNNLAALDPPERFYHGFVLRLLVSLGSRYEVSSNAESGYGRCDVMLVPREPGQPGVVLELKVRDTERGETVEEALARALGQLRDRDYAAGLRARGAQPVHELGLVLDGKRVHAAKR